MSRYLLGIVSLAVLVWMIAPGQSALRAGSADDARDQRAAEGTPVEDRGPNGASADAAKPIIKNKELMKLLFDPYYVDLRRALREEPDGRTGWRRAYIAIFRLAEVTNLLYSRGDKDYMLTGEWRQMVTDSRDAAAATGQAVLKRDYPLARQRYERLIQSCNACHQKFEPTGATEVQAW